MTRAVGRPHTSFIYFHKRVAADMQRPAKGKLLTFVIFTDDPNEPEIVAAATFGDLFSSAILPK